MKTATLAYRTFAIMNSFEELFTNEELAKAINKQLSEIDQDIKIDEIRSTFISLKRSRGVNITETEILSAIKKALRKLVDKDDRLENRISESYEFDFDVDMIDDELIKSYVNVDISGRVIVIELEY